MMEVFAIDGPAALRGEIVVRGAKNSVLKLMAATLLAPGRSVISNVPAIADVRIMCELLRRLGCGIDYDAAAGTVAVEVPDGGRYHGRLRAGPCSCAPRSPSWVR
jgi:UDP-N-acetylglucosamine 1-carboxyvinyltransferase